VVCGYGFTEIGSRDFCVSIKPKSTAPAAAEKDGKKSKKTKHGYYYS
jgi:hypothetical protein